MDINKKIKEKIVLAVDVDTLDEAKNLVKELKDYVGTFKVGLQFFTGNGSDLFKFIKSESSEFFFDIKLHDIPNTVKKASENIIRNGASFFNLHAQGGAEMMRQAAEGANKAAAELGYPKPVILAVTVLTSISQEVLKNEMDIDYSPKDYVLRLAKLAKNNQMSGVVASANECKIIKEVCGKEFKVLCPGIRPAWSLNGDQKRTATPEFAIEQGADYIVIGRAVTSAADRIGAMKRIYEEIERVI